MGRYVFRQLSKKKIADPFDVDGRILETYGVRPYTSNFVALVELEDESAGDVQPTTDFSEGVEEPSADEQPTCAGKDGDCSRTVDNVGDVCWQHPDE